MSDNLEAKMTGSQAFGEIVWLMMQLPIHKYLLLADLEWLVKLAMRAGQYADGRSVGLVLWAFPD